MRSVDYQAYLFRIEFNLTEFPLDYKFLSLFLRNNGFIVKTYIEAQKEIDEKGYTQYAKEHAAFTVIDSALDEPVIYINDTLPFERKTKSLLHEVGHIYLKHTYRGVMGNASDGQKKSVQEEEADQFASAVSAPPCVMKQWGITSIEQLCDVAQLPLDDAVVIAQTIKQISDLPELPVEKTLCSLMQKPERRGRYKPSKENLIMGGVLIATACLIFILGALFALGVLASPALAEQGASILQSDPLSSVLLSSQDVSGDVSGIASSAAGGTMTSDTTTGRESATPPNTGGTTTEPATPNNPVSQYTPQYTKSSSRVYTYPSKPATPLSGVMVCVTQAGDKYHLEGCPHLDGHSYTKTDRSTAKDEGLEPCLTCSPDSAQAPGAALASPSAPVSSEWAKINLNTATLEQIKSIPGLSADLAESIYEFRQKAGYFGSMDEILNVPGCGYAVRNLLREYCYVER